MKSTLLLLSILGVQTVIAQSTKRVLFIGNSYTASNNLPQLVKDISQSTGDDVVYDSNLIGGMLLMGHATNATTLSKIQQGNLDFVVLQDQSQVPSFPEPFVQTNVYPYASQLNTLINNHNPCAETVFYMTWGRKNGDGDNCPTNPSVCTYEGMDNLLKQRYLYMSEVNDAIVSPVGAVWRAVRTQYPTLNFYEADESHPNIFGSYAAALTFYTTIFRKNPELVTYRPSSINETEATAIKSVVKNVVFDQLNQWFIGSYDTVADFSVTVNPNPLTFNFQNNSQFAESYLWDFGDGTQSTLENPVHTFASSGIYTVQLTALKCGLTTTKTLTIDTNLLSTGEVSTVKLEVYPNPVKDYLNIKNTADVFRFSIFDISGRMVKKGKFTNNINVKDLQKGTYIIHLDRRNNEKPLTSIFIKK